MPPFHVWFPTPQGQGIWTPHFHSSRMARCLATRRFSKQRDMGHIWWWYIFVAERIMDITTKREISVIAGLLWIITRSPGGTINHYDRPRGDPLGLVNLRFVFTAEGYPKTANMFQWEEISPDTMTHPLDDAWLVEATCCAICREHLSKHPWIESLSKIAGGVHEFGFYALPRFLPVDTVLKDGGCTLVVKVYRWTIATNECSYNSTAYTAKFHRYPSPTQSVDSKGDHDLATNDIMEPTAVVQHQTQHLLVVTVNRNSTHELTQSHTV